MRIIAWFKNMALQGKLLSAFLMMGLIVFVVGWIGQSGSFLLSQYLDEISDVRLPSIVGLQMIDQGLRIVHAGEFALLNTRLSEDIRQEQLTRINQAKERIEAGYNKYQPLPRTQGEDKLWQTFLSEWKQWQQDEAQFQHRYQKFAQGGIFNPQAKESELLRQGQPNSTEMAATQTASMLLEQMNTQVFTLNQTRFNLTEAALQEVIQANEAIATDQKQLADKTVHQTQFWVLLGMIGGTATAILLGTVLSLAIAKPLNQALNSMVNLIVSTANEITATVEQQERITSHQAASVNQTTTTMDQLGASSKQAAAQAEAAAARGQQILSLTSGGTQAVGETLEGMSRLKQKVEVIAQQIGQLTQQTHQIGNISTLVSELANQTNMLALNAAVEAAHAKEYGQGFSVIATEIRKLADESKQCAAKINTLVADIQTAINSTVMATGEGTKTVEEGVEITQKTAATFQGVADAINQIVVNNQQLALTAKQQAIAIQQVVEAMNSINTGAQQTASGISQTKVSTQKLNEAAWSLKALGSGANGNSRKQGGSTRTTVF